VARPAHRPAGGADRAHAGERPRGWVPVKARRISADATDVRTEPNAGDTIEALPREPHDSRETHETRAAHTNGHLFDDGHNPPPAARALHPRSRAIRITRVKTNGRRRWSVDFLVRKPDDAN
jgi:hypothetical protein